MASVGNACAARSSRRSASCSTCAVRPMRWEAGSNAPRGRAPSESRELDACFLPNGSGPGMSASGWAPRCALPMPESKPEPAVARMTHREAMFAEAIGTASALVPACAMTEVAFPPQSASSSCAGCRRSRSICRTSTTCPASCAPSKAPSLQPGQLSLLGLAS